MLHHSTVLLVICSTVVLVSLTESKNHRCTTVFAGCKIVGDACECDSFTGCRNPFDFKNLKECQVSMYTDPCNGHLSCNNGGWCLQRFDGGYACKCSGTGYYGSHCEKACPEDQNNLSKIPKADYENAKACIY